jgi:GT2 family glycosyltransferase
VGEEQELDDGAKSAEPKAGVAPLASLGSVTVVVCNHNGETYLPRCLDAILGLAGVDEVLVADDASTDASLGLLRRDYPTVGIVALAENRGPGAARNAGMRAARNEWVLAVDNDAVLEPDTLAKLLKARASHPDAVALQPRSVVDSDPDCVHYDSGSFHYVGLLALRNFFRPLAEARAGDPEGGVVEVDALIGIAPLVNRDALLSVGGYDEDLFYLAEDFDLALRLRLAGMRIVAVEDAIVRHRGGTEGLSFRGGGYPERRAYLHARNRWILMAKCFRTRTLFVAAPGILLYESVFTLFALLEGNLMAHMRGKRDFFFTIGTTLRKRRSVQGYRRVSDRSLLVGGPLTFSPSLLSSAPRRIFAKALNSALAAWWRCVRALAG